MAEIFPSEENISRLKVQPTPGEAYLLNYLQTHLDDSFKVFFQPFLNGDKPDIIILKKNHGVTIIEVKDWNLDLYRINEKNTWYEMTSNSAIRSPFQQVFGYKSNMYSLHINGLAEKNVLNPNFWKIINVFVFFYGVTQQKIDQLYQPVINAIKYQRQENENLFKTKRIEFSEYEKKYEFLSRKLKQISRDNKIALTTSTLNKIERSFSLALTLFDNNIEHEFIRYLQPPFHVLTEGKAINYTPAQLRFTESTPEHIKIQGIAGSGKTTILAKRAVNAHKRHHERVLILTYNKTLRNYIHDRISDVRENFSWDTFCINNYHSMVMQAINRCGILIEPPSQDKKAIASYFDQLFSDIDRFKGYEDKIIRYKTILLDETQDYKPEWIKIIRQYFLDPDDNEMILFGDDNQNIYDRESIENKTKVIVQGFGSWHKLPKSMRFKDESPVELIAHNFQVAFLKDKYNLTIEKKATEQQGLSIELIACNPYDPHELNITVNKIYQLIRQNNLHPNDVCIISSNIALLRKIDFFIRTSQHEQTHTTFEEQETYEILMQNKTTLDIELQLEKIRSSKKFSFHSNSGGIKLSTVHSFKGLESHTVFFIMTEEDHAELVYTAITRTKFNLVTFLPPHSSFNTFFRDHCSQLT